MKNFLANKYAGLIVAIVLLSVILAFFSPYFLKINNFINIGNQIAINVIIAMGMTLVICSGGIDLSVGANVALTGIIVALFFQDGRSDPLSVVVGLLIGLVVGIAIGLVNGVIVSLLRVPPFIATLGTTGVFRGLALIFSKGRPIMGMPDNFLAVFSGFLYGIPKPVIAALVIAAMAAFLFYKTTLGRYIRGMGGNEQCIRICGINLYKYKVLIYTITGCLGAVSGLVLTTTMATADPLAGNWFDLEAIAVVVMGGTSLEGGKGTIYGTLLGALLLGLVRNGLNILGVQANYHQLFVGIIILIAVLLNSKKFVKN